MATEQADVGEILIRLHAFARKLEEEGQYNLAKAARAASDSLVRSQAYALQLSSRKDDLASEGMSILAELVSFDLDAALLEAFEAGTSSLVADRLAMFDELPHPYVCRFCGRVEMEYPTSNCPRCNRQPRTFQRFPPVYWLETMDPLEALQWLENTPQNVRELISGHSESELSKEAIPGEWSIRETLTHLRDAQAVLGYRVDLLIKEENPLIESQAVFAWAKDGSQSTETALEIFDAYFASRQQTLEALRSIELRDWWRVGKHEEFGTVSIKQQASYFATHELTHLPQIEAVIRKL